MWAGPVPGSSHNFLSMIFGILGQFRIDIGDAKKFHRKIFHRKKMFEEKKLFSRIFKIRYLRDHLELEKNKNISPHLLVEICSFPESFEMTETIGGYQNMFSLQKESGG